MRWVVDAWRYYTPNERFAFFIAFLWLCAVSSLEMFDPDGGALFPIRILILVMSLLGISTIGALIALFVGGGGFETWWRRLIDRCLPLIVLIVPFFVLTALNNPS